VAKFKDKFGNLKPKQVELLARKGWTDKEMAEFFDVSLSTWCKYKRQHTIFATRLEHWKAEADEKVERSLYENAMGFVTRETKVFYNKELNECVEHEVYKEHKPDFGAQAKWLSCRKPAEWREVKDVNIGGEEDLASKILDARKRNKTVAASEVIEDIL